MKITLEFEPHERLEVVEFLNSRAPTEVSPTLLSAGAPVELPAEGLQALQGVESDIDEEGLPWDERIHSSNRKKTAKGVWARRRNITDGLYEQVKAELLGSAEQVVVPDFLAAQTVPTPPAAEVPAPPPAAEVPTPPAAAESDVQYNDVEAFVVNRLSSSDAITALSIINPVLAKFGLSAITDAKDKDAAVLSELLEGLKGAFNDTVTS